MAMLEENVLIFSRFYPLSLWALPMPFGGLLSCFTLRLEAGITAAPNNLPGTTPSRGSQAGPRSWEGPGLSKVILCQGLP